MNDPYSVLGVSPRAGDDEIKKVYRELARKYHPDNYHDNPLSDLAQEKMKEINEAYDTIMKQRSGPSGATQSQSTAGGWHSGYSQAGATGAYAEVRNAINRGDLQRAEKLLDAVSDRGAEWNFLMGSLCYRKGWLDEASWYFQNAVNMDPTNYEYRQALSYMSSGGSAYAGRRSGGMASGDCDMCTTLLCADCLCECMGGDLIPCC